MHERDCVGDRGEIAFGSGERQKFGETAVLKKARLFLMETDRGSIAVEKPTTTAAQNKGHRHAIAAPKYGNPGACSRDDTADFVTGNKVCHSRHDDRRSLPRIWGSDSLGNHCPSHLSRGWCGDPRHGSWSVSFRLARLEGSRFQYRPARSATLAERYSRRASYSNSCPRLLRWQPPPLQTTVSTNTLQDPIVTYKIVLDLFHPAMDVACKAIFLPLLDTTTTSSTNSHAQQQSVVATLRWIQSIHLSRKGE